MRFNALVMIISAGLVFFELPGRAEDPAANDILKRTDLARGGGLPGIAWNAHVFTTDQGGEQTRDLTIKAADDNILVEFSAPLKVKGQKMLMVGRNMWFAQPGLQKPVPISPRLRLTGQAAN